MRSNLDALSDVLRGEALSEMRGKSTNWVWTDAHLLYERDVESFRGLFEVMSLCARMMSQGDPQNPNNHDNPSRFFSQAHGTSLVQRPVAKSPSSIDSSCQRQSASLRTGKRP